MARSLATWREPCTSLSRVLCSSNKTAPRVTVEPSSTRTLRTIPGTSARISATRLASNARCAAQLMVLEAALVIAAVVSIPAAFSISGDLSCTTRLSSAACSAPLGGACGLHTGQTDSGNPWVSHQSPFALYSGISAGLHLVHLDSGRPCSTHQSVVDVASPTSGNVALGLQIGQNDSGYPCSSHQSPVAR